jgi:hypothetical protein
MLPATVSRAKKQHINVHLYADEIVVNDNLAG